MNDWMKLRVSYAYDINGIFYICKKFNQSGCHKYFIKWLGFGGLFSSVIQTCQCKFLAIQIHSFT